MDRKTIDNILNFDEEEITNKILSLMKESFREGVKTGIRFSIGTLKEGAREISKPEVIDRTWAIIEPAIMGIIKDL